uniref:DUF4283 domain-containing protein n=1 Tax=Nicotiana tabacum TaxID=4097 RepID=A0A1S4BRH2_TOBAC|nr:PREDICTED: uncharacterized protein LOC107811065 [Nicotiana tabacum]
MEEMQGRLEIPLDKGKQKVDPPTSAPKVIPQAPWTTLFPRNRTVEHGMNLTYILPEIVDGQFVVNLDKPEVENKIEKWRKSLMYVIGEKPGYNYICRYVAQYWNDVAEPEIYLHEEGYYIIRFQSIEDVQDILYGGPYTINNRPIILKQWTPDFDFKAEFLIEIPLMASTLGNPLFADGCTTKMTRVSYARIIIEVNVTKALPNEITVKDPSGRQFQSAIEFEWKPVFCAKCLNLGHNCAKAPHEEKADQLQRRRRPRLVPTWRQIRQMIQPPTTDQKGYQPINEGK